jgi:hypothetical protein
MLERRTNPISGLKFAWIALYSAVTLSSSSRQRAWNLRA